MTAKIFSYISWTCLPLAVGELSMAELFICFLKALVILTVKGFADKNHNFSFWSKHLVLKITLKGTPSALLKHFTLETCHGDTTMGRHFLCWKTEFHHCDYFNRFSQFLQFALITPKAYSSTCPNVEDLSSSFITSARMCQAVSHTPAVWSHNNHGISHLSSICHVADGILKCIICIILFDSHNLFGRKIALL